MLTRSVWGFVTAAAFIFGYIVMADTSSSQDSGNVADPEVGIWQDGRNAPAPDFSLATLEGDTLRLSDLRGKIVLLNFWATWCGPCRDETPALVQLDQEFKGRGVQFVGVSVDDSLPPVRSFVKEFGVPYPIAVDDGTVEARYKEITGYPTTYLINPQGEIERYMGGALTKERLRPALQRMLGEQAG